MEYTVATCYYLKDVIGLGSNQAGSNNENTIISEGLNNPTNLVHLGEDDGVKIFCHNVRKPTGTEPQPGWITPNRNTRNVTATRV